MGWLLHTNIYHDHSFHFLIVAHKIWKKIPKPLDAFRLVRPIAAKWSQLGQLLGVSLDKRTGFDHTLHDPLSKLEHVVNEWLSSYCSPPTFQNLYEVVSDPILGESKIADAIKDFVAKNEAKYISERDYTK